MNETLPRYGDFIAGVGFGDISGAADALMRAGVRPSVRKVRAKLGTGSPNTINPLLDEWWKRLAGRLDQGPAALHRLPEPVLHVAEALWLQALDAARGRAVIEQALDRQSIAHDKERLEVRSHVLSLREAEMDQRIKERDKVIADLETRLQIMATALKREQSGRNELARKITALESAPSAVSRSAGRTRKPARKKAKVAKKSASHSRGKGVRRRQVKARKGRPRQ